MRTLRVTLIGEHRVLREDLSQNLKDQSVPLSTLERDGHLLILSSGISDCVVNLEKKKVQTEKYYDEGQFELHFTKCKSRFCFEIQTIRYYW